MKVAVIGAEGFIGRVLTKHLNVLGHEVVSLDVKAADSDRGPIAFRRLDVIQDEVSFDQGTDAVFYLAQSPFYRDFPAKADHLFGVNTLGAIKAVQAAVRANVNFFCYASTGNVYQPSFQPLTEKDAVRRDDPYALSKVMAEESLSLFQRHLKVTIVRFFGVFGEGQRTMLPWKLFEMIRDKQPILLTKSLHNQDSGGLRISFCYVDDAARVLARIAESAAAGIEVPFVLNVAGPEAISIRRFAETLGSVVGIEPMFQETGEIRPFDLVADIGQLLSLLPATFTPFSVAMQTTCRGLIR